MFYNGKVIDISVNYEEFTRHKTDVPYREAILEPGF
jgi:hypothetical protein